VRQFASKLFALYWQEKADCEGTPMDAECLKRNLSYAIRVNCQFNFGGIEGRRGVGSQAPLQ
jgi:hypothetical protein